MIHINIPNKLVMLRFFLLPLIIFFLYYDSYYAKVLALILFLISMISDQLDGIVARKFNQETKFGAFMDQLSDKVVINLMWIVFLDLRLLPIWLVLLNLFRELVVTGIRGLAITQGYILKSEKSGKIKAGMQMSVILMGLIFAVWAYSPTIQISNYFYPWMSDALLWFSILTVFVAYWAFIEFIIKNQKFIKIDS